MKIQNDEVRIHPAFSELLSQLKAVEYDERGRPDKKKSNFDIFNKIVANWMGVGTVVYLFSVPL